MCGWCQGALLKETKRVDSVPSDDDNIDERELIKLLK